VPLAGRIQRGRFHFFRRDGFTMCRLLGAVSSTAQPLTALLKDDLPHFTALSCEHSDGWGVAHWSAEGRLSVVKSPQTAQSSAAYHAALRETHTDAAILHLRKASPGMVNGPENTHPFATDRIAFAHNGWASDVPALDRALAEAGGPACCGTTDSERYFGLLQAAMRSVAPEVALTAVAAQVNASMRTEALNCLLLTEDSLYAFASFDSTRPTASGNDPVAAYRLGFRVEQDSVVVASIGWERPDAPWEPLPNGRILRVRRGDLHTSVHRLVPARATATLAGPAAGTAAVAC
jgi:predicted glutamine amidotransferase